MGKRSLLGGAKRQQRVTEEQEEERSWLEQIHGAQRSSEARLDSPLESPVEDQGPQSSETATGRPARQSERDVESDLTWSPSGTADTIWEKAEKAGQQAEELPRLPWTFDDAQVHPSRLPETGRSDRRSAGGVVASGETSFTPQTANQDSELSDITSRDLRNRRLTRVGWALLLIVVLLTLLLGFL